MANRIKISGTTANNFSIGPNGTGNLTANTITITNANISNTVTATYFVGDGSKLTGISGGNGNSTYSNSNVASYYASNQIIAANASLGNTVVANYFVGNGNQLTGINGSNVTNTVPNANIANIANVANYVYYSNVGGLGNIATINLWSVTNTANIVVLFGNGQFSQAPGTYYGYSGSLYANNAFLGNGVYGNYFSGDGGNLSNINGSNVSNTVPNANIANVANYVSYSNVGGLGNIATINLWGNPSTANNVVLFGNGQFSQAPLTYYGYSSNVWAGNAYFSNVVQANYFVGSGSQLTSIPGANVSGQVPNASVASTVYTNAQPNITSVGTLTSLSVTGDISGSNINASSNTNVTGTLNAGNIIVTNGIRKSAKNIASGTTLTASDSGAFIELISYGNTYTVILPDPTTVSGAFYKFWQNTNVSLTLSTSAGNFVGPAVGGGNLSNTKSIASTTTPYWEVCSDGTNWVIFAIKMA